MRLLLTISDRQSCYAALQSADVAELFASGSGSSRHFCRALRIKRLRSDGKEATSSDLYVGWAGDNTIAANRGRIELSQAFADCLGLVDGEELDITAVVDPAVAVSVMVEPSSIDDWEVVELQANFIEEHLLSQIAVVSPGMVFPVWIHGQQVAKLKIDPADSNRTPCFLLGRDTELIVASRKRDRSDAVQIIGGKASKDATDKPFLRMRVFALDEESDVPRGKLHPKEMQRLVGVESTSCLIWLAPHRPKSSTAPAEGQPKPQLLQLEIGSGLPEGHISLCACVSEHLGLPCFSIVRIWRCQQVPICVPRIELVPIGPPDWVTGLRSSSDVEQCLRRRFEMLLRRCREVDLADGSPVVLRSEAFETKAAHRQDVLLDQSASKRGHCPQDCQVSEASDLYDGLSDIDDIYPRRPHEPLCAVTAVGLGVFEVDLGLDFVGLQEEPLQDIKTTEFADEIPEAVTVEIRFSLGSVRELIRSSSTPPFVHISDTMLRTPGQLKLSLTEPFSGRQKSEKTALGTLWSSLPGLGPPEEDWAEIMQLVESPHSQNKLPEDSCLEHLPLFSDASKSLRRYLEAQLGCIQRSAEPNPNEGLNEKTTDELRLFRPEIPGFVVPGAVAVTGSIGSGKTTLCRRVMADMARAGILPLQVSCGKLGQPTRKFKLVQEYLCKILRFACWYSPSVVLLDDVGALCPDVEPGAPNLSITEERSGILAELLLDLLPQVRASGSRIAIVATMPDDAAVHRMLWRWPALEHKLPLRPPQLKERPEMLQILLKQKALDGWEVESALLSEGSLDDWGGRIDGFSIGDLVRLVDRSCVEATVEASAERLRGDSSAWSERQRLTFQHLERAVKDFVPSSMSDQSFFTSSVKLADIGGLDGPKKELIEMLTMPTKYAVLIDRAPVRTRKGLMLVGPPGCGKTFLVQAAANETKGLLRFLTVKGPELLSKYIGESEAGVRKVFERAAAAAPSVIFFDEIEALAPKRGADSTGVTDRVVNQMLCYLDGVEDRGRVFVVAATGRPDLVDAALMRPGRFDKICYCGLPTEEERLAICEVLARKNELVIGTHDIPPSVVADASFDLKAHLLLLVSKMPRLFTSADVNALFSSAKIEAVNESLKAAEVTDEGPESKSAAPALEIRHLYIALATAKASVSEADNARYQELFAPYRPGSAAGRSTMKQDGSSIKSGPNAGLKVALA